MNLFIAKTIDVPFRLHEIGNRMVPIKYSLLQNYQYQQFYKYYQWLHHYTCSGFCKTSYHLLISPPLTNLLNTLKIHIGENRINRQSRMWRQCTCYFPANGLTNLDVFQPKTFPIPWGIIPQNFSSLGFAVSEELRNKQTKKQTHRLTH